MRPRHEQVQAGFLFLVRTLVLYFLLLNSFFQLRELLDLVFLSCAFLVAVLAGLWMEKARLRILPALALAALLPFALRALFFLVFRLQRALAPGPATDFLFFIFDSSFLPGLAAYGIAWLFTFLALRHRAFAVVEVGLNSLLLLLVFWTQAGYRVTVYPHPSILAWVLALFVVAELFVLLLARRDREPERIDARAVLGFAWVVVPLVLVFLLFLLGKYSEGAVKAGGGLMKPTLFRFDFAPYVRLESEIRTSDETVLLFRTEGKAERFLLRRFVLSGYAPDRGFFMDPGKGIDGQESIVPDAPETFPDPGYRGREPLAQEYFFLTIDPSSLIAVNYPVRVAPLKNWKSSSFLRVYRVDSMSIRSLSGPESVARQPPLPAGLVSYYTNEGNDGEIKALALQVVGDRTGYYDRVAAIERYLKGNYLYSLKPGIAADGNQLHHFLFESKKGYCSYFAFAMALMCRSLGIPARVSVGFFVDPQSEVLNFYEVRAFQAHAWVEVYFGDIGWVEFDPTSEIPAPGEDFSPFLGPDRERMAKLIREILENQTGQEEQRDLREAPSSPAPRLGDRIGRIALLVARLWYITLPALYALFLLAAKLLPSGLGLLARDRRRRARALYRLCLVRCAGVGLARRAAESRLEHASRIEGERGVRFAGMTDAFLRAAFGDRFDAGDLDSARKACAAFLASFRKAVPWPLRILGALNPLGLPSVRP